MITDYFTSPYLHYHIRITLQTDETSIQDYCDNISTRYLYSSEVTHYHIYAYTNLIKTELTQKLKEKFNVSGNKYFSVQTAKDEKQLQKYVLKDGYYKYKGFTEAEVKELFKSSFKKGKDKFMIELEHLEQTFIKDNVQGINTFRTFAEQVLLLKIRYNQNPSRTQLKSYLDKMYLRAYPNAAREYIHDLYKNDNWGRF